MRSRKKLAEELKTFNQSILKQYLEAINQFKNSEVPYYMRLAQARLQTPHHTRSELLAGGGVIFALSLSVTGYALRDETPTLSSVLLFPLGVVGCYFGVKDIADAIDYETYLENHKRLNSVVQQIIRARQSKGFDKALYVGEHKG